MPFFFLFFLKKTNNTQKRERERERERGEKTRPLFLPSFFFASSQYEYYSILSFFLFFFFVLERERERERERDVYEYTLIVFSSKESFTVSFFVVGVFFEYECLFVRTHTKEESKHFSTLGGMPVTGWLRGTVKAVPSGDTVLIVANAGPTVRASCIYIYMFLGAFVSFFFFFCRGDGVSSLFRDVFSLLFWVP